MKREKKKRYKRKKILIKINKNEIGVAEVCRTGGRRSPGLNW